MKKLFVTGVPVTGDGFTGRNKELSQLEYFLENGQSVVLIAPRRFGKTSLILKVLEKLQEKGGYIADVDLFTIVSKGKLAEKIVENTLKNKKISWVVTRIKKGVSQAFKNLQLKQVVEDYEVVLKFAEPGLGADELLETALDFPQKFAEKEKKDLYFFYDEFGDIEKLDGESLVKMMRGKFQRHTHVCYIFAGSHESLMRDLFTREKSAFYKFTRVITLEEISFAEFSNYIRERFKQEGILIPDQSLELILDKTRGHPYYTQLLCGCIHYLVLGTGNTVDIEHIEQGFEDSFNSERTYLEKIWEELTSAQIETLFKITDTREGNLYSKNPRGINIARSIKSLLLKGIIKKTGKGKYKIIDPYFEEFLRRNK
jgi:AAA+ ATPase superfamily predicted ATPase